MPSSALAGSSFPGLNGKLAFHSFRDRNAEIYVMNADGTNQTRLTKNSAYDWFPTFSPDGSEIAFSSDRDGNFEIYAMDADGMNQTRLTSNSATDGYPVFSPDGSKIAFESDRDGNYEIYVMNANGTNQTRLTNNSGFDAVPAFSPDGSRIAFESARDGNYEIYVMNANGTNQTRLTSNSANDQHPVFSPDGSKIAFDSLRDGNYEVYAMNADGTNQTRLTDNGASDQHPAFSPDGSKIAFDSHRDGNFEIYVMDANGVQTNLTRNVADDLFPSWQPLPLARTPVLTAYRVAPRSFFAADSGPSVRAKKPGARVSFTLSETATVLFRVQQRLKGRDRRRRLRTLRGSFSFGARRGKNSFHFTGRLRGRKLRPGRYALVAAPRTGGKTGRAVSTVFRVKRRRRKP